MGYTTIPLDPAVRDRLRACKRGGETYNEVIVRLIEESETDE